MFLRHRFHSGLFAVLCFCTPVSARAQPASTNAPPPTARVLVVHDAEATDAFSPQPDKTAVAVAVEVWRKRRRFMAREWQAMRSAG